MMETILGILFGMLFCGIGVMMILKVYTNPNKTKFLGGICNKVLIFLEYY